MPYSKQNSVFNKQSLRGATAGGYSMSNIPPGQAMGLQGQIMEEEM